VTGSVEGLADGTEVFITKRVGEFGRDTIASGAIEDGVFRIELPAERFGQMYELNFSGERAAIGFFAEAGTVVIEGQRDNIYFSKIGGTPENDKWREYMQFNVGVNEQRNAANGERHRASRAGDNEAVAAANAKIAAIERMFTDYRDSLVRSGSRSMVSLYLAKIPLPMMNSHQIDSVLKYFDPQMATNPYYVEMRERADLLRRVEKGAVAPEFTAQTPEGEVIRLSDFRGKYLVLDFWASWCVPCRAENPGMIRLYERFHPRGLEVLSFSLDNDAERWKKAIEEDGMVWHHASDLIGGRSPIVQEYGIDGIPAIWFIDPDGVIMASGLRGEQLFEICERIFGE